MRRVHFACNGGGEQPLKVYLRRITESKVVEIPAEQLTPIIEASHDSDYRRDIMKHLRECLSEPSGKRWHRIYAGMLLVEKLLDKGTHVLAIELAHGHHFDLIQKVSLLEHFDSSARGVSNPWAQDMVRNKAAELRQALGPMLEAAAKEELPIGAGMFILDIVSNSSPGGSIATCSTSAGGSSIASSNSPVVPLALGKPGFSGRKKREGSNLVSSPEVLAALSPRTRLQSELKRITESGIVDVPPEFFTYTVEQSYDAESRRVILKHLQGCLEVRSKWQRVNAALTLVDMLMQRGAPQFVAEASQHGTNLVKKMWQLQEFEFRADWRAQNLVRKKARALHDKMVHTQVQATATDGPVRQPSEPIGEAFGALKAWAESGHESAPSEVSSKPSSHDLNDLDDFVDAQGGAVRGHKGTADFCDAEGFHDANNTHCSETFFTPMQTPAPERAIRRPSHLLSL